MYPEQKMIAIAPIARTMLYVRDIQKLTDFYVEHRRFVRGPREYDVEDVQGLKVGATHRGSDDEFSHARDPAKNPTQFFSKAFKK